MHGVHVSAQLLLYATRRPVPEAHGCVATCRREEATVRTEGDTLDFLSLLQRAKWSAGGCVPEDHRPLRSLCRPGKTQWYSARFCVPGRSATLRPWTGPRALPF